MPPFLLLAATIAAISPAPKVCIFTHQIGMVRGVTPAEASSQRGFTIVVPCDMDEQDAFRAWRRARDGAEDSRGFSGF